MGHLLQRLRLRSALPIVLATLLATAFAALVPGPAAAAPRPLIGAQTHATWGSVSFAEMRRELDLLARAGANLVRADLNWSSLELEGKGELSSWYANRWDRFLDEAEARGLAVIATVFTTPCWASTAPAGLKLGCVGEWWSRGVTSYPPRDPNDLGDAVESIARRWGKRLEAIEIWNQPNQFEGGHLVSTNPAATYTRMLRASYRRAKAVAPSLQVLGGVIEYSDAGFLRAMYRHGAKGHFDGISIHPYNEWRSPLDRWRREYRKYTFVTGVPRVHRVMRRHGDGVKKLWLTEFGWSHCTDGDRWCVSKAKQARYVGHSIRVLRRWKFVAGATIYQLRDADSGIPREDHFGLVTRGFKRKRSYRAFKRAIAGRYPRARSASKR